MFKWLKDFIRWRQQLRAAGAASATKFEFGAEKDKCFVMLCERREVSFVIKFADHLEAVETYASWLRQMREGRILITAGTRQSGRSEDDVVSRSVREAPRSSA